MAFEQIKDRSVPPVAGIDLEQSLNYTASEGLPLAWFYTSFTYPRVFYRKGSRPFLEEVIGNSILPDDPPLKRLRECLRILTSRMKHFSLLGFKGQTDRGMSEEDLLRSGQGWCNEQVRVLIALTQIVGLPSRLVFAGMQNGRGHVLTEVYCGEKWVLVDQTEGYLFARNDGSPVNVLDFKTDQAVWQEVDVGYKAQLMRDRESAQDKNFWERAVPYGVIAHPLELFHTVGYGNYFIH